MQINSNICRQSIENSLPNNMKQLFVRLSTSSPWREKNHELKCIFIHIPRSAGTSINKAIFGKDIGHPTLYYYYAHNPIATQSYFKFTFTRNPWDRLVSAFHLVKNHSANKVVIKWRERYLNDIDTFDKFIDRLNDTEFRKIILAQAHFRPQIDYISINDKISVDYIGRFENINNDFENICQRIGLEVKLNKLNAAERNNYRDYYDDKTKTIVESMYDRDIQHFDYTF